MSCGALCDVIGVLGRAGRYYQSAAKSPCVCTPYCSNVCADCRPQPMGPTARVPCVQRKARPPTTKALRAVLVLQNMWYDSEHVRGVCVTRSTLHYSCRTASSRLRARARLARLRTEPKHHVGCLHAQSVPTCRMTSSVGSSCGGRCLPAVACMRACTVTVHDCGIGRYVAWAADERTQSPG